MTSLLSTLLGPRTARATQESQSNSKGDGPSSENAFAETLSGLLTAGGRVVPSTASARRASSTTRSTAKAAKATASRFPQKGSFEVDPGADQPSGTTGASAHGLAEAASAFRSPGEIGKVAQPTAGAGAQKHGVPTVKGELRKATPQAEGAQAESHDGAASGGATAPVSGDSGTLRAAQVAVATSGATRVRQTRTAIHSSVVGSARAQGTEQCLPSPKGISNPKVSTVALAATQASAPPVKDLRAPDRVRRQSAPESGAGPSPLPRQEVSPATVLISAALSQRSTVLAAPAEALEATVRSERATATADAGDLPAEGAVLRNAAHLRVESPELGQIALHLRVRGGVAEVRFDGDRASALRERVPELARALASEGLALGKIDPPAPSSGSTASSGDPGAHAPSGWEPGSQGDGRKERDPDQPEPPAPPAQPTQRSGTARAPNHLHVQA
jgi:hypothetical protein